MPKQKHIDGVWITLIGIILLISAGVFLIIFLTTGNTTTSGKYPDPKTTQTISCSSSSLIYPFFTYDHSKKKNLTINATFDEDSLSSISLLQKLFYDDAAQIKTSNSENHAAMNLKTQAEGLGPDAFDAHYSELSDGVETTLYAKANNIDQKTEKYFLLDGLAQDDYKIQKVLARYQNIGLNCQQKNNY